jgi:hypothetical protein
MIQAEKKQLLARLRRLRGLLPQGFKLDRSEIHERSRRAPARARSARALRDTR